jgi:predicted NBD/HSP70 family sugar kinase
MSALRLGIDLGGTKIEIIALHNGIEVYRKRITTPNSYRDIILAIASLVNGMPAFDNPPHTIGIGMPGAITAQGVVKNSNTVCLNGKVFKQDIEKQLQQSVSIMNDANCFTLSEAVDGAAANANVVFGVILGTGVGGGIAIAQQVVQGCNSIAGEWGHNPLPITAPRLSENDRQCYCGKLNCIETYLCGSGLAQTYSEKTGKEKTAQEINILIQHDNSSAIKVYELYKQQLAASLATVINILDPDCIVLGGGLSHLFELAENTQYLLPRFVFSDSVNTQVVKNRHGDSSGVRGAAWL